MSLLWNNFYTTCMWCHHCHFDLCASQGQFQLFTKERPHGRGLLLGVVLLIMFVNSTIVHYERTLLSESMNTFIALETRMIGFEDKPSFSAGDEHVYKCWRRMCLVPRRSKHLKCVNLALGLHTVRWKRGHPYKSTLASSVYVSVSSAGSSCGCCFVDCFGADSDS